MSSAVSGELRADGAPERPLVYAGRFAPQVVERHDTRVLDDLEASPGELLPALEEAPMLVILDPLSFPFESLRETDWDCPLVVCLPSTLGAQELAEALGKVLLERLTFFDRVVTDLPEAWEAVSHSYGLATSQRLELDPGAVVDVLEEALRLHEAGLEAQTSLDGAAHDGVSRRGAALAPEGAAASRSDKATHRVQARALRAQLTAAKRVQPATRGMRVLMVGAAVGEWASLLGQEEAELVGADVDEALVGAMRETFPRLSLSQLEADLRLPSAAERFDLAFSTSSLRHLGPEDRERLLAQLWQAVRPGGRLVFLEEFVATRGERHAGVHPLSIRDFTELLLDASNGGVVLEHLEALRSRHDEVHRAGVVTVSKVGVAQSL